MPRIGDLNAQPSGVGTPTRIVWSSLNAAYPARPSGLAAGLGDWVGPVEPTDGNADGSGWVDGDIWHDIS